MVSHILYGLIAFGAGIRGLCLRQVKNSILSPGELEEPPAGSPASTALNQHVPMPARMSYGKFFSLTALGLLAAAGINWRAGQDKLALLLLVPIPMFLIGLGLSQLLYTRKKRRAYESMSNAGRARLDEMSRDYGKRVGMYFAVPLSSLTMLSYVLFGHDWRIAGAVFAIGMLVTMPFAYQLAAPLGNVSAEEVNSELIE